MQRNKRDERPAAVRGRGVVVCFGVAAVMMCAWLCAGAAWAQEGGTARVTADWLNFRESCGMEAPVQGVLTAGAEIELLGEPLGDDGWVRVRDADGQEGCVSARYIEVTDESAPSATLEEMETEEPDLEAEHARMEAEEERREAELRAREAELDDQVTEESRRAEYGKREERLVSGFVDLSYGVAWAASEDEEWRVHIDPNRCGGVTDDRITYHAPRGDAFSIGGGILFGQIGAGLRFSQQVHEDPADIDVFGTCPPPFAAQARTASDLERRERAFHASFVWAPVLGDRFVMRLLVGPTLFDVTQDTVDNVFIEESPDRITGFVRGEQDDTAVGFHLGVDASWYWGRFGVGLLALYSSGEVELRDRYLETFEPPDPDFARREVDVGGVQAGVGLRIRL